MCILNEGIERTYRRESEDSIVVFLSPKVASVIRKREEELRGPEEEGEDMKVFILVGGGKRRGRNSFNLRSGNYSKGPF